MAPQSPAGSAQARNWGSLSLLHERVQAHLERVLGEGFDLSAREYALLEVLSRQHEGPGGHLQMKQVADSVLLSQSATTRLVTRLEERGLMARFFCPTDRRGIYTQVTPAGFAVLEKARPAHDRALEEALSAARREPAFQPLVAALDAFWKAPGA
ncbi:MarR family winged helix-turn-helix transcriptional regulator [Mesoterricola silvestris]|uniref:Transcriptional regulator n=1 Tax=Mesoterricola silvestris TaxID=2927979 RepID=A0AA48H3W8_9BACT|nr:MarR family transcriptional regulator [Mesoterricola silvestris]BDU71433.1 transcriptional regulator [Mesoterricola silvestris]